MRCNRALCARATWAVLAGVVAAAFAGALEARASDAPRAADRQAQVALIEPAWRGMRKDLFVSSRDPQMEMRVAPELKYIGKVEFDLGNSAHVERHHFAAVEQGEVTRMLVLQFEEMLPSNDDIYRWTIKKPQTIGNQVYQFSTFVFSVAKATHTHPEAEVARTQALLSEKNLRLQDELAVVSFARVIGKDRRHEFTIFYNEPLAAASHRLQAAADGAQDISPYENLSAALTERALASFSIAELPDDTH